MILAHLDLDAFYAAVEELESPELRTKPLVVGGDPRGRGVVQQALSTLDFDFDAYAAEHFERLQRTAAEPRFRDALG